MSKTAANRKSSSSELAPNMAVVVLPGGEQPILAFVPELSAINPIGQRIYIP